MYILCTNLYLWFRFALQRRLSRFMEKVYFFYLEFSNRWHLCDTDIIIYIFQVVSMRVNDAWNLIPQVWMALVRSNYRRIIHQLRVNIWYSLIEYDHCYDPIGSAGGQSLELWFHAPATYHIFVPGTLQGSATIWTYRQTSLSISSELLLKFVADGNT